MKIGTIDFGERPLFLAPMEDVTDIGFRHLCKRFGAAMVYTEFVSAEALVRSVKSTVSKLTISDEERPVGIQIYGRDVPQMVEAAKIVESEAHPDLIDLNFGCPVKKVASKGAGAGMLRNIPLLLDITREVVKAVKTPVTVKTRLGWDSENLIITDLAEQLQDCGIQALTIHGRTRSQMYTGEADWTLIGAVKANPRIHIPIIGNGDIRSLDDADAAFDRYGVDAVMIGRATFGQPWIFSRQQLSIDEKIDILKEQLLINIERIYEMKGVVATTPHPSFPKEGTTKDGTPFPKEGTTKDGTPFPKEGTTKDGTPFPKEESAKGAGLSNEVNTQGSPLLREGGVWGGSDLPKEKKTSGNNLPKEVTTKEKKRRSNEYRGILHTRRHLAASPVFKGIPDFRQTRIAMLRAESADELIDILEQCRERLKQM